MTPLVRIENLSIRLPGRGADRTHAVEDLSLAIHPGEIVCVVGESGSGKSMTAAALMGLLPEGMRADKGRILLGDQDLMALDDRGWRAVRGARIGMIFQEPMTALNPLHRAGQQIAEMLLSHRPLSRAQAAARAIELLAEVGLPDPPLAARAYPHELSGGQRQRVMIAMALALEPQVLIADEPTTALDVTVQAQILDLIRGLQRKVGMGVLFITHDFGVVAEIADRVLVMQQGKLVEQGPADQVLRAPRHGYTQALIAAVPSMQPPPPRKLSSEKVMQVKGLRKTYRSGGGLFGASARVTQAVADASLDLARGATLGIVGESGSGKSTLARCLIRLIEPDAGQVDIGGVEFSALKGRALRRRRDLVQMVFQDPFASLNPRRTAGDLVAQGLVARGMGRAQALDKARALFTLVGLDPAAIHRLPHQFSGGQRQRIGLARALALEPKVLIADEAVSALDVSVQAKVLELLRDLRERLALSMVFITHDLRVAAQVCDQVIIMQRGTIVEAGPLAQVFAAPAHAYTQSLLASVPGLQRPPLEGPHLEGPHRQGPHLEGPGL